ncbi:MAG: winged helix-turn-helix domain-containing protein [Pyrinomonadaceae bacterium]
MSLQTKQYYEFAGFRLDLSEKILLLSGQPVPLTPKVFATLEILVENAGRLLEKDFLIEQIWEGRFVEESNLTFNIKMLRKALGDDAGKPSFIETVPRRGYRFIAEVKKLDDFGVSTSIEDEKHGFTLTSQKPYFLLGILIISLLSIFGLAFVWLGEKQSGDYKGSKFHRLTNTGKVTAAAVSPDGKNIVFAQKESDGESLWAEQIETGLKTQILEPGEIEFVGLTVSPDNNFVYYSVFSDNAAVLTLSRIYLYGGTPEPLQAVASDVSVGFSPDGRRFAFTESKTSVKETYLKIANSDGSDQRVLITTKGGNRMFPVYKASPVAWSPDGTSIACVVQEADENGYFYRILLVDPDGGGEKYLLNDRWNLIRDVVWEDAENLAFIGDSQNSPAKQIWEVSLKTGNVHRLTEDLNDYQWLGSAAGKLFTVQKSSFSSIQVADYVNDAETLQPKQVLGESGRIENVVWSRDGWIFYNSWTGGKNEIWGINPDGTSPRQLTRDSNLTLSFDASPIDDRLVFSTSHDGKISLSEADRKGENILPLTDQSSDIAPVFSPDGKSVVFQRGSPTPTLWRFEFGENQPPEQLTGYFANNPSFSPDGRTIAFHFMDYGGRDPRWRLGLIDAQTRRFLKKLDFPVPITERKTVWHPKEGFLTMAFSQGEEQGLLLLWPEDGHYRIINKIAGGKITSFDWSPDGSRLAFSQKFETGDVVSLQNH